MDMIYLKKVRRAENFEKLVTRHCGFIADKFIIVNATARRVIYYERSKLLNEWLKALPLEYSVPQRGNFFCWEFLAKPSFKHFFSTSYIKILIKV